MTQTKAEKTMIFNKSAKELREDCAIPMFCDLGPCDYSCLGTCNAVTFSSYPSDFTDEMCDYLDSLESDENIYTDIPWIVEDQMIRGVKYKPKQEKEKPMGKSIEKHYCTKCVHGILCESGELKCNHEAWTTTKDGTYAYPNGLRQIKSRDKPSWCPGFKAMQENKPNVNTKENANEETECQSKPYQIDSVKKQLDRIELNLDNKINRYGESVVYRNAIDYVDMIDREYGLSWAMGNALWKLLIAVMYKDESDEMPYDDMERVMRIRLAADELETILGERQICEVKQYQDKENKK